MYPADWKPGQQLITTYGDRVKLLAPIWGKWAWVVMDDHCRPITAHVNDLDIDQPATDVAGPAGVE